MTAAWLQTQLRGVEAGGGPPVVYKWRGRDMQVSSAGVVDVWRNSGTGARAFDLIKTVGSPTYGVDATGPYALCGAAGSFQTFSILPNEVAAYASRTMGIRCRLSANAAQNLIGFGAMYDGQVFDLLQVNSSYGLHLFGQSVAGGAYAGDVVVDIAVSLETTIVNPGERSERYRLYLNGTLIAEVFKTNYINTQASFLQVGNGAYAPLNNQFPTPVYGAFFAQGALPVSDINDLFASLSN